MFRYAAFTSTCLASALTVLGLSLAPLPAAADATLAPGSGKAAASLDFRIIIPAVMRVIENSHPLQIEGDRPVEQRLVVLSNMRHGFCASLRVSDPQLTGWQLKTEAVDGVTLQPTADGYRLCASRPGRYTLRLQHGFDHSAQPAALAWPVQTELMAL